MIRLLACLLLALPSLAVAADEKAPKSKKPEGPLADARRLWLHGNYEEARSAYQKLLDNEQLRTQAAVGIARSYLGVGDPEKALAAIDDALTRDATEPDLLAARADLLFTLGRWEDASKVAEDVIKRKSDQFLARWVRARLLRDT